VILIGRRALDNQIDHENNGNENVKPLHRDQGIATIQQQEQIGGNRPNKAPRQKLGFLNSMGRVYSALRARQSISKAVV
jgi:hypothetical protein